MFVNNILAKGGLKPTDIAVVGVGVGSGAVAAMEKGEISAISNLDPVIAQLGSTGKFVAVADSRTEKGMNEIYSSDYHASVIYITDEFIKKIPTPCRPSSTPSFAPTAGWREGGPTAARSST